MSHFIRPLALAESINPDRYDVRFHAPTHFAKYLQASPLTTGELTTMPSDQFLDNLARGKPAYPAAVIRDYVRADRTLLRSLKPDLVIGDMRLSLSTSAALEGTRCAGMINAYWSPYTRRRAILPSIPITRVVPPKRLGPLYRLIEPLAYEAHTREINRVRKELDVPPLPSDLRILYTDGD